MFRGRLRRRASSRGFAQKPDYLTQLALMKRNPPRLKSTAGGWLVELFSSFISRYMELTEWKKLEDAEADKESWDEAHVWTLKQLRNNVREQQARARMAALLR